MELKRSIKKFWAFLKKDSWSSFLVTLILAFIIIKFVFFPLLTFITGTSLPLVIVESCSMYHQSWGEKGLQKVMQNQIYENYNLDFENAKKWSFKNGLNKGDIVFVIGRDFEKLKVGDVIIFEGGTNHPIIHRIISINEDKTITTKGDNNSGLLDVEKRITENQMIGKSVFRVPYIGWIKLIFFEGLRDPNNRGFC